MWGGLGESLKEFVESPALKAAIPILMLVVGWYAKRSIDWIRWRRKQFLHRLIVSLNSIQDGRLMIRTIFEKSLEEVFLNSVAVGIVADAAGRTTNKNPLVPLPKEDSWHILNSLLNAVAERFDEGVVRRDMGLPVRAETYVLCLTHEQSDDLKQDKIRAMLVRKSLLLNLPDEMPQLESPTHELRYYTLKSMAAEYGKTSDLFTHVEICLAAQAGGTPAQGDVFPGGLLSSPQG